MLERHIVGHEAVFVSFTNNFLISIPNEDAELALNEMNQTCVTEPL